MSAKQLKFTSNELVGVSLLISQAGDSELSCRITKYLQSVKPKGKTIGGWEVPTNQAWHEMTLSPPKGESKVLTEADYHKYLAMRDELIMEQKKKIESQQMTINKLRSKLNANHNNN